MKVPCWLKSYCTEQDLEKILKTVKQSESATSGEIVPMIVRSSVSRIYVPLILFLSLSLFGILVLDLISSFMWILSGIEWRFLVLILAAITSWFLRNSDFFLRLLTPKSEMVNAVQRRAQFEFYQAEIQKTKSGTGFLIFVSLAEHRVVVLGDKTVSEFVPPHEWNELVNDLVSQVKRNQFAQGMCDAIQHAGRILEKSFPRDPVDVNELPNHLVVKE